jgi:hypothetical protein
MPPKWGLRWMRMMRAVSSIAGWSGASGHPFATACRTIDDLKPIVILDAGFVSKANLALLKERHYHYLVNVTRGSRKKYASFFEKETFEELPGRDLHRKVEVKKIIDTEDQDSQLVLCRSAQRRLKEEAMISKVEELFIKDLAYHLLGIDWKAACPTRRTEFKTATPSTTL